MPWLGTRRVVFVPLDRGQYNEFVVPPDWKRSIEARVYYDPIPTSGIDASLRTFILTMSQGRADIVADVADPIVLVKPGDVAPTDPDVAALIDPIAQSGGYDAGAVIMLGGVGAARNYGFWSRFVMREGVGYWAMELMHGLTGMRDLYSNKVPHDLGGYDTMAYCQFGTHPTAYTRMLLQWLDPAAIASAVDATSSFVLHATCLGPAPAGRVHAVQTVGTGVQVIAEARLRGDQFDGPNQYNSVGIPGQGVIVYEVVGTEDPTLPLADDPLISLLTPTAIQPGQTVTSESGITVRVDAAVVGGFAITIQNPTALVAVPNLFQNTPMMATTKLHGLGLLAQFSGANADNSARVFSQNPTAGDRVPKGATVALYLRSSTQPL